MMDEVLEQPRSTSVSARHTVIDRCGTRSPCAPCAPCETEPSVVDPARKYDVSVVRSAVDGVREHEGRRRAEECTNPARTTTTCATPRGDAPTRWPRLGDRAKRAEPMHLRGSSGHHADQTSRCTDRDRPASPNRRAELRQESPIPPAQKRPAKARAGGLSSRRRHRAEGWDGPRQRARPGWIVDAGRAPATGARPITSARSQRARLRPNHRGNGEDSDWHHGDGRRTGDCGVLGR